MEAVTVVLKRHETRSHVDQLQRAQILESHLVCACTAILSLENTVEAITSIIIIS